MFNIMTITKIVFLFFALFSLFACSTDRLRGYTLKRADSIVYVKDNKTELCYAYNAISDVFVHVPCTTKVMKEIINK